MGYIQKKAVYVLVIFLALMVSPPVFAKSITITASATPKAGGAIMPSGRVPVDYGADLTFNIIPNNDYEIADVTVDGISQGAVNKYTFTDVTSRHSIKAKFRNKSHTITIVAGENVEISPSGLITTKRGKRINFVVKPLNSDTIPILLVDGEKVNLVKSGKGYKFTLTVTGDHAVMATSVIESSVHENTRILDDSTIKNLSSISQDGTILIFANTTPLLESLSPGDIIICGVTPSTPHGLLRKVINVSRVGSQLMVETVLATLEDALKNGQIQVSETITPSNVSSTDILIQGLSVGKTMMQTQNMPQALEGFYYELKDVVLYDGDGNSDTKNDQIKINGSVSLNPSCNLYVEYHIFQPPKVVFTITMEQKTELESVTEFSKEISEKREIARHYLTPIVIDVGIPVVVVPVLTVNLGIDGDISAGVTTQVTQQASFTAGLSCQNGNCSPISTFSNNFEFDPPSLSAGVAAKAYASLQLTLLVYDVAGPYGEIKGYLDLEADIFSDPWWQLYAGLEADVGVRVEAFSKKIVDFESPGVIGYRILLAQASTNHQPTISALGANPSRILPGGISTVSVSASDPEGDPLTYTWSANGGNLSALTGPEPKTWTAPIAPGTYTVTVSVTDNKPKHNPVSQSINITVGSAPTLTVSNFTANPSSGTAPLNGVSLTAGAGGTATGTINYTFYCNRSDTGTNITSGYAAKYDGVTDNPKTASGVCSYSSAGTYTAKVIVERGGATPAEARTTVTVGTVSPISWEFNTTGNFEGWTVNNMSNQSVQNGSLQIDPAGADPYISSPGISVSAGSYKYVQISMASNALDGIGTIYFRTQIENSYAEDKKVTFSVTNCSLCGNAPPYTYNIYMGNHPKWTGTITGIRIDPANNGQGGTALDTIGIDYIRITP